MFVCLQLTQYTVIIYNFIHRKVAQTETVNNKKITNTHDTNINYRTLTVYN